MVMMKMMTVVVVLSVCGLIVTMFYFADSNVTTEGVQLIGNV